jgi:hypothetical protein
MGEVGQLPGDACYVLIGADCAETLQRNVLEVRQGKA